MNPRRFRIERVVTWFFLLVAAGAFLFPLLFMFIGAFKPREKVLAESGSWLAFWPSDATLDNFAQAITAAQYPMLLRNSLIVSCATVVLCVAVNSMFGYALSRFEFRGRRFLLIVIIAMTIVPFQAIAIPLLYIMSMMGLRNTFSALVLPFVANPFYVYLFYSFFRDLPRELDEAARIDGAGPFRIFWSVFLPLSGPALSTVAILAFLTTWGELMWPTLIADRPDVRTIPLGLAFFRSQTPVNQGAVLAFVVLATLPIFVVFVALQRYFVASVARSGIKG
jgi:multiple sugar transport system permease protein